MYIFLLSALSLYYVLMHGESCMQHVLLDGGPQLHFRNLGKERNLNLIKAGGKETPIMVIHL